MIRVSPIKLQVGTKVLWFDPQEHEVKKGDGVVVSTERGHEFGTATADVMEVSDELVASLRSPLKPVIRIASEADADRAAELRARGEDALPVFKELAAQTNDDMRPIAVDFLFEGDRAVFYFESEQRVDFRDLVRRLASHFHVRVDMRQIGVRDGARIVGGLGHCGQELCCKRLGGDFNPVSIRMAKEQNLSLNPQKISGCCGRLMCCLRYEFDTYKEVNSRAPKQGGKVEVPGGTARVTEVNVPLERVTLLLEDGKSIKVPLSEMDIVGEGKRPNSVSEEVFEKYSAPDPLEIFGTATFETASFTGTDKLADPKARPHLKDSPTGESHRKPRRRRRGSGEGAQKSRQTGSQKRSEGQGKGGEGEGRRSRSRGGRSRSHKQGSSPAADSKRRTQQRPGQKSSGVRNAPQGAKEARPAKGGQAEASRSSGSGATSHRRPRRRRLQGGSENAASSE